MTTIMSHQAENKRRSGNEARHKQGCPGDVGTLCHMIIVSSISCMSFVSCFQLHWYCISKFERFVYTNFYDDEKQLRITLTGIQRALDGANVRPWSSENRTGHLELQRPTKGPQVPKVKQLPQERLLHKCHPLSNQTITICVLVCRQNRKYWSKKRGS